MYCGQRKKEVRAAGSHRIRVQGTQETDAFSFDWCRQKATFAPWGFVDGGALLISSFEYCNKIFEQRGKKNNTQRRAAEECREESNYADFCACKQTNWLNNVMRWKMLSTAAQQEAGKHFTLILPRQFLATVFQGSCSSVFCLIF